MGEALVSVECALAFQTAMVFVQLSWIVDYMTIKKLLIVEWLD